MRLSVLFYLLLTIFINSCKSKTDDTQKSLNKEDLKKKMETVNQYLVKSEDNEIDAYTKRHFKVIQKTKTGLRYYIYEKGNGETAKTGLLATINYTSSLINGLECYSSKIDGPKTFEIGKGNIESGLEEGILLLQVGDKAKFVLPSHLAWGLLGDQKKIPKRATLIYDVELIKIQTKP